MPAGRPLRAPYLQLTALLVLSACSGGESDTGSDGSDLPDSTHGGLDVGGEHDAEATDADRPPPDDGLGDEDGLDDPPADSTGDIMELDGDSDALSDAATDPGAPLDLDIPSSLGPRDLSWVRVDGGRLVDEYGRTVLLRGINARIRGLFDVTFDDGRLPLEDIPEFDATDCRAMAVAGFNLLRMPINWSGLEPREGEFSETYLARMDEVADACISAGLYVLADFHQDAWSKEIGEDGAPLWAIVPPPEELLGGPMHDLDQRRQSTQVLAAFASFYANTENVQDRFMPAWRLVASRYADRPGVIGYELQNEPVSATSDGSFRLLYEFYERAATALRAVDARHTLWLEPDSIRNLLMTAPTRSAPFPDGNVVYSPHLYPGLTGMRYSTADGWVGGLRSTFDAMVREARSWGDAAVVLGEWGTHPQDETAPGYTDAIARLSADRSMGIAFWLWKENSQGSWGFFDWDDEASSWIARDEAFLLLGQPYAGAVPGRLVRHRFDTESLVLDVEFEARGGEAGPVLFLGRRWLGTAPLVILDGEAVAYEVDEESGRTLLPWAGARGRHTIVVRAGGGG